MKIRSVLLAGGLGLAAALAMMLWLGARAAAVEAAPVAQSSAEFITVTVKPGESLATYARLYGVTGSAILRVNIIRDPNIIFPGQIIVIPVFKSFTPSLTTPFFYVAQAGDDIFALGRRFEMDPNVIARANGGSTTIVPGETYLIPAGPHLHIVQQGETLKSIADRFGVSVTFLLTGNNLPNPDLIFVGQPIFIPIIYHARPVPLTGAATPTPTLAVTATGPTPTPSHTPTPGPTTTPAATSTPTPNFIQTTVRPGESLVTYVFRYGVSGASLLAVNPQLRDPHVIFPGQTITIPVVVSFTPSRTTPFFYVVQGGETPATIALKFEMSPSVLVAANPGASFAAGSTILVPAGPHIYTVQPGDELRFIAAKYGTTVEFLLTGNNLPNPDFIFPGQLIFIPIRYNAAPLPF
jgi:LysM repeat protein